MAPVLGSNSWRLDAWGPACELETSAVPIYAGGPKVQVRKEVAEAVLKLGAVFLAHSYIVRRIGGYNCRKITGGSVMSPHAWGIAVDVNDDTNPYRLDRLVTDMPAPMIQDVLAIRTRLGIQVWRWGGNWDGRPETPHSNYDAMHFELVCSRIELSAGFEATIVAANAPKLQHGQVNPKAFPVLRRGSSGIAVTFLQDLLGMERLGGGAGTFGPRTEEAAKLYQRSRGLVADGIVGLGTWTSLLTAHPPIADGAPPAQRIT